MLFTIIVAFIHHTHSIIEFIRACMHSCEDFFRAIMSRCCPSQSCISGLSEWLDLRFAPNFLQHVMQSLLKKAPCQNGLLLSQLQKRLHPRCPRCCHCPELRDRSQPMGCVCLLCSPELQGWAGVFAALKVEGDGDGCWSDRVSFTVEKALNIFDQRSPGGVHDAGHESDDSAPSNAGTNCDGILKRECSSPHSKV